jgi:hypothetical protein
MSSSYSDQPPEPKRRPGDAPHEEAPADLPKLGSLAQAARSTQLRQAKRLLIGVGALTAIFNAIFLLFIPGAVKTLTDQELVKNGIPGRQAADPVELKHFETVNLIANYVHTGLYVGLGVLFVGFGFLVHRYPVPITVTSLVLFLLLMVISFFFVGPWTLAQGWIIKLAFVIGIIKAIQAAFAYEKERREQAALAEPEY